jgi:hypothetical protein
VIGYQQVLADGALIEFHGKTVADIHHEIARGEWVPIDEFARLTGVLNQKN